MFVADVAMSCIRSLIANKFIVHITLTLQQSVLIHLRLITAGWILMAPALMTVLTTAVKKVLSWTDLHIQHV